MTKDTYYYLLLGTLRSKIKDTLTLLEIAGIELERYCEQEGKEPDCVYVGIDLWLALLEEERVNSLRVIRDSKVFKNSLLGFPVVTSYYYKNEFIFGSDPNT